MTESEWLSTADLFAMLDQVERKASARKHRLFACACSRRLWALLNDKGSRGVIEEAERFADGLIGKKELSAARAAAPARADGHAADQAAQAAASCAVTDSSWAAAKVAEFLINAAGSARGGFYDFSQAAAASERQELVEVLREIVGNPFRPIAPPAHWPAVVTQLAEALYAGGDCAFALHDALLDAGHVELAAHFADAGRPHPKGCWVVDLILGKK